MRELTDTDREALGRAIKDHYDNYIFCVLTRCYRSAFDHDPIPMKHVYNPNLHSSDA